MSTSTNTFRYKELHIDGLLFDPGELIQIDVEKNIEKMLGLQPEKVKNIIVVGAWRGNEVASFLRYPNAMIYCFEPNETNFQHLFDRWGNNKRVMCFKQACASFDGESELHEANLTGNDSLLAIKHDSKNGLKLIKTHTIQTVRLDSVKELVGKEIDLLWADTQGYELEVLSGAPELVKRTKALFLEVYKNNVDYEQAAPYAEVMEFLDRQGFSTTAEGLDKNGGGNALFLNSKIDTNAFLPHVYESRIRASVKDASRKRQLLNFKIIRLAAVFTPVKLKTLIRKIMYKLR